MEGAGSWEVEGTGRHAHRASTSSFRVNESGEIKYSTVITANDVMCTQMLLREQILPVLPTRTQIVTV